jgi:hypothetical protein
MKMHVKQILPALTMVAILGLTAARADAQVVGGGYVGFGTPGLGGVVSFGTPYVAPAPVVAAPVVPYPYVAPYPNTLIVPPRRVYVPVYGRGYYGPGWHRGGYHRMGPVRRW